MGEVGVRAVVIIGGASAFGRDHGGAEGMFRGAAFAELGAIRGPEESAKNLTAGAGGIGFRAGWVEVESLCGVEVGVGGAKAEAAGGNDSESAPGAVHHLEDLMHPALGVGIAGAADHAGVGVFDGMPTGLELGDAPVDAFEDIDGFEAGDDDGDAIVLSDGFVGLGAHDGTDMAGGEEALDTDIGGGEEGDHGRGYQAMGGEQGEIAEV